MNNKSCPKFENCNSPYCPLADSGLHRSSKESVCSYVTKFSKGKIDAIPIPVLSAIQTLKQRMDEGYSIGLNSAYNRYLNASQGM